MTSQKARGRVVSLESKVKWLLLASVSELGPPGAGEFEAGSRSLRTQENALQRRLRGEGTSPFSLGELEDGRRVGSRFGPEVTATTCPPHFQGVCLIAGTRAGLVHKQHSVTVEYKCNVF